MRLRGCNLTRDIDFLEFRTIRATRNRTPASRTRRPRRRRNLHESRTQSPRRLSPSKIIIVHRDDDVRDVPNARMFFERFSRKLENRIARTDATPCLCTMIRDHIRSGEIDTCSFPRTKDAPTVLKRNSVIEFVEAHYR